MRANLEKELPLLRKSKKGTEDWPLISLSLLHTGIQSQTELAT